MQIGIRVPGEDVTTFLEKRYSIGKFHEIEKAGLRFNLQPYVDFFEAERCLCLPCSFTRRLGVPFNGKDRTFSSRYSLE